MNKLLVACILSTTLPLVAFAQEKTYTAEEDKLVITEQKVSRTDLTEIDSAIAQAQAELSKYQAVCADIQNTLNGYITLKAKALELGVTAKAEAVEVPVEEIKPE